MNTILKFLIPLVLSNNSNGYNVPRDIYPGEYPRQTVPLGTFDSDDLSSGGFVLKSVHLIHMVILH